MLFLRLDMSPLALVFHLLVEPYGSKPLFPLTTSYREGMVKSFSIFLHLDHPQSFFELIGKRIKITTLIQ